MGNIFVSSNLGHVILDYSGYWGVMLNRPFEENPIKLSLSSPFLIKLTEFTNENALITILNITRKIDSKNRKILQKKLTRMLVIF